MTLNKYEGNKLPYHVVGSNNKGRLLSASNSFRSATPSSCRTSVTEYTNDAFPKRRFKEKNSSPYLYSDRIQLLSRITEKRFIHKKNELFSSFPLANKVYKASSDEFKIIKKNSNQKPKKSVLTLPNVPAPAPQACTVSDMNDSDYGKKSNRKRSKCGKVSIRSKGFEVYDRDAQHIHLDASSSDFFQKQYNEDEKNGKAGGRREKDISAQDVWAALQNINKFQFRPSPRMTGDTGSPKNKIYKSRRGKIHNSKRLIETCRTEEIAYVANFEIQSSTSSFDRITVIHNMPKHANDMKKAMLRHQVPARLRFDQGKEARKSSRHPNERLAMRHNVKCVGFKNNRALMHHANKVPETKDTVIETGAIVSKENIECVSSGRESIDSSNYFRTESETSTFIETSKKTAGPTINTVQTNRNFIHGFKSTTDKLKHGDTMSSQQRISNGTTLVETSTERRKPRLVTTMPSAATMPKMTVADIKKRIANLQFPLVILGKEQVSSAFEVPDYEDAHFQGFEKGVWPFMLQWTEKEDYSQKTSYSPQVEPQSSNPTSRRPNYSSPERRRNLAAPERRIFGSSERQSSPSDRRTFASLERQSCTPDRQNISQSERRTFGTLERQSYSPLDRKNMLQSERKTFAPLERRFYSPPDRQTGHQAERRTIGPPERQSYSPPDRQTISQSERRSLGPVERQSYSPPERRSFSPLDQQRTLPQSVKQIASKIRRATYNNDINEESTAKKKLESERSPITATSINNKPINVSVTNKSPIADGNCTAPVKPKPMRQFKDKMLKLLYKKSSTQQVQNEEVNMKVNTDIDVNEFPKRNLPKLAKRESLLVRDKQLSQSLRQPPVPTTSKHPWAKAKWASDFIDNVMKKIKSGVYYTHFCDNNSSNVVPTITTAKKMTSKNSNYSYFDDVSVLTATGKTANVHKGAVMGIKSHETITLEPRRIESLTYVPGFDDIPLGLEIKSLNFRQISVKHGLSNVVVQFDIATPKTTSIHTLSEIDSKSSFIPISVTERHTKIFKCNTSILNAVLPAELCSVIPKVMRNLFESNTTIPTSTDTFMSIVSDESSTPIAPLLGVSRCAKLEGALNSDKWVQSCPCSPNDLDISLKSRLLQSRRQPKVYRILNADQRVPSNPWSHRRAQLTMPTHLPLYEIPTPLIKVLKDGRFSTLELIRSYLFNSESSLRRALHRIRLAWSEIRILPQVSVNGLVRTLMKPSKTLTIAEVKQPFGMHSTKPSLQQLRPSNALQIYTPPSTVINGFSNMMQSWWKYFRFDIHITLPFINPLSVTYNNKSQTLNIILGKSKCSGKTVSFTINNMQKSGVYEQLAKMRLWNEQTRPPTVKCIEYEEKTPKINNTSCNSSSIKKSHHGVVAGPALRTLAKNRENHEKVILKKKSRTSVCVDKMNTCLNKITSLEEFYQALGVAKFLCDVFDGCSEKKVLSCVGEMKNWVKDISPQQALLVLILTSKRDTPNLIRFRPVLLQGIAVNRITGVTELDMEIEVIEKENLKMTQFEGMSYLLASQNNQDNLLEELYWIAKTTASDYQRPFDDTSKKLLKNLLYKRKALNPSYLRVMARYVGLGLLKTSLKNIN